MEAEDPCSNTTPCRHTAYEGFTMGYRLYTLSMVDNKLFYGDNLEVLAKLPGESVDLIYLDPPFNSRGSTRRRCHEYV